MNPKLLAFLLPCIIGIPMLLLNLGAIGAWASFEESIGEVPTAPAPLASAGKFISGAWFAHNERSEREEVFDATQMTMMRNVSFSRIVTIDEVLKPGESAPRQEFHQLFVLARAPALSMDECPRLLEELALTCAVGRTSIKPRDEGGFRLTTRYVYIPEHDLGDTSQIARAHLERKRIDLTPDSRAKHVAAEDLPALRIETYRAAIRACDELRHKTGSCALSEIDFDQAREAKNRPGYYQVDATATMSWLKVGLDRERVDLDEDGLGARISGFFSRAPKAERERVQRASARSASGDAPKVLRGGGAFRPAGSPRFSSD